MLHEFTPDLVPYKKGSVLLASHVVIFVSYLLKVGGSLWALQLSPPVKLAATI